MTEVEMMLSGMEEGEREELLVRLLERLKWGPGRLVPPEVFTAICSALTTTGIELVVVRYLSARPCVLLFRRSNTDKFYAGQWHTPGSLFYGHETPESVLQRLMERELRRLPVLPPRKVGCNWFNTPRGAEVTQLYVTISTDDHVGLGEWFPLSDLPDNLIDHHRVLMEQVSVWLRDERNWSS
jgi:hypothetical protein